VKVFSTMRRPDMARPWTKQPPLEATGSGVVIEGDRILTNAHVVAYASQVQVQGNQSGDKISATVVAFAAGIDLALLKLDDDSFFKSRPPLPRAKSLPRIKDAVLAYGFPTGGTSLSITRGIVSRIEFVSYSYLSSGLRIQIDAAINPGNSGGPLADLDGAVVGLNSAVIPFAQGVGFAIPSNTVRAIADQILSAGRVVRPWIGISGVAADASLARRFGLPRARGVLLAEVRPHGPAEGAGLLPGDLLTRLGTTELHGLRELIGALARLPIGGAVDFEFARGDDVQRGVLRIAEAPPSLLPE
jgi:S1-C subfamily serine protease